MRYMLLLCIIHGSAIAGPDQPWNESSGGVGWGAIGLLILAAIGYVIWSDYKRQVFGLLIGIMTAWLAFMILGTMLGAAVGGVLALSLAGYVMVRFYDALDAANDRRSDSDR